MTGKIKRRSLRCGGRPKADFGSLFTSVIAPAFNAAGSIADESIDNNKTITNGIVNNNTTIPSDPTKTPTMRLGGRKKCWIGAAIGAATSIAGSLFGNSAQKREMRRQQSIRDWQDATQEAANMTSVLNNSRDYQEDYLRQFRTAARLGKTLGAKGIYITDGGNATKISNNTYLLRGGSHEDVNETGQTGIGINVGGNEIEAEGGEVAQKKNGALRIFSAQPILGGISPAQAVMRGANKDKIFNAQQRFKSRHHLSDDGGKAKHGTEVPYKRIHINEDGTFTDTLTGKNYNTSATNGEDVVITGKANHWKEAGKKDTSSYFDPMGAVNFATAAGAPILNANPSNVVGSIRDSKSASDFLKHYMMQDTGGFVNTKWAKEHPYLSLGINAIGDIGLGIGTNKAVDILRYPLDYGKYGYKLNKLYKKAGLLNRGEPYSNMDRAYGDDITVLLNGREPYTFNDYKHDVMVKAERQNPNMFHTLFGPNENEKIAFKRNYRKKATDNVFTEMHTPIRYGFNKGIIADYDDLMNHNPEYYKFLEETNLPWNEQSTVDAFLKRQQTSLRGVYASNNDSDDIAKKYLTELQAKRKGGDGLNTNGGLYTSNSTGIANAFKNPTDGVSEGYIGKLHYDFGINRNKPIAEQLRKYRSKIVRGGDNNVFAGNKYYKDSIKDAIQKGAIAIEDKYGRSNGDVLNVTERAYFPGSAKQQNITLQDLKKYSAQENQKGRWNTQGVTKETGDDELFVPREYNRFDDFIREARIFLKPTSKLDSTKISQFIDNLETTANNRVRKRNKLLDNSRRLLWYINSYKYPRFDYRLGGRTKLRNGGLTSKDRGFSKRPYPSVSSKDFAGGGRSYPIPTKADAVDALRLAGLHGRSDVRSKVYSKYPSLRKKSLLGSSNHPVKSMRPKALGGMYIPFNKRYTSIYDAPDYDSDYNGGNVLGNGEVTVTAKRIKPTFMKPNNDAMNLIKVPKEEVPYIPQRHNRSRTIFSGGDYLGLGIDTLAALSTGLVNYNTAGKYILPDRAPIIQASKLPTTYNVNPEIEEVKRYRDRLTGQTFNNTSSSVAALNRSSAINLDALSNLSKLWATKENEENKMLTEDAKNQQTIAAQNAQNELARQSEIARIKNEAIQAKGDALNVGLSGLSQAWTNFWTAGRTAYEDDQARRAMVASSKDATPTRLIEMGYDLYPDLVASLYRTAKDDRTKRFYLSRLSSAQRQKYGIN